MLKLSLFCLPLFLFGWQLSHSALKSNQSNIITDSVLIQHKMDGLATEWPADRIQTDEKSGIQFAFDNDASNLYVIISVKEMAEQMKMIRMSMKMFIDLKAKKKENMGVEFPVKRDPTQQNFGGGGTRNGGERTEDQGERKAFDIQALHQRLAINLISMKIFGFEGMEEPKEVGLFMANSTNLVYNWDTANIFHIEYKIPLSMIAEPKTLDNKEITIGWKVHGLEIPSGAGGTGGGGFQGGRGGGGGRPGSGTGGGARPAPGSGGAGDQDRQASFEKMKEEQNIWSKYTFHIAPAPRAF